MKLSKWYNYKWGDIATYQGIVSAKLEELFGLEIVATYDYSYTSLGDTCKISEFGNVSLGNVCSDCNHEPKDLTATNLLSGVAHGTITESNVLWTGHKLEVVDGGSKCNYITHKIIITYLGKKTIENFDEMDEDTIIVESVREFMHELSHDIGATIDHYCKFDYDDNGKCSNHYCDKCYLEIQGRHCLMNNIKDIDIEETSTIYCNDCKERIINHLNNHHYY